MTNIPNFNYATDLIVSAADMVETNFREKPSESWLYILPNPTEAAIRECDQWLNNPYVHYCAFCYEINKKGEQVFIFFLILNTRRKPDYVANRFRIGGGLILSKKPYRPGNRLVVDWMRGPWKGKEATKGRNATFWEMRHEGYIMGGRKADPSFLACTENWVDTFMLTPEPSAPEYEERPSAPKMVVKLPEKVVKLETEDVTEVEIEEGTESGTEERTEEETENRTEEEIENRTEDGTEEVTFKLCRLRFDETNMTSYYETFMDFIGRIEPDGGLTIIRTLNFQQEVEEQME